MARHSHADAAADRTNIYDEVTSKIIRELEDGRVPWVQPSSSSHAPLGMPKNSSTGRNYGGINVLILWYSVIEHAYPSQEWLTYRQAQALGGHIRKGEHGTTVFFADRFVPREEKQRAQETGDDPQAVPFLRRFTVFNLAQCEGPPEHFAMRAATPAAAHDLIDPKIRELIRATGADFRIGGDKAFYNPVLDYVQVPPPEAFYEPVNWARTACHELSHYAGGAKRLNRDQSGAYGPKAYLAEELTAEISAGFICASLGIVPTVRHSDYVGAWLAMVKEDNRAVFRAASQASKCADYLLAFLPQDDPQDDRDTAPCLHPEPTECERTSGRGSHMPTIRM